MATFLPHADAIPTLESPAGEGAPAGPLLADLAARAGLPAPRLYLIDDPCPTACAVGRGPAHASVAVTTGLLDALDRRELRGVLARELARIAARDRQPATVAAAIAGAILLPLTAPRLGALAGRRPWAHRGGPVGLLPLFLVLAPRGR